MKKPAGYSSFDQYGEAYFLYLAFAPVCRNEKDPEKRVKADLTLVKVGVSVVPMERLVSIHCSSPFRVASAGFAGAGHKGTAEKAEFQVLDHYRDYVTRGEWLMVPNDPEFVSGIFDTAAHRIFDAVGLFGEWRSVSSKDIAAQMNLMRKPKHLRFRKTR